MGYEVGYLFGRDFGPRIYTLFQEVSKISHQIYGSLDVNNRVDMLKQRFDNLNDHADEIKRIIGRALAIDKDKFHKEHSYDELHKLIEPINNQLSTCERKAAILSSSTWERDDRTLYQFLDEVSSVAYEIIKLSHYLRI